MDKRIGAQFFTVRDYAQTIEDFDKTCKKVKDIGYKLVQISGTPLGAREMREVLDKYSLKAVTSHRPFEDFVNNVDEIIEYNKILGCDLCGLGAMPQKYWDDGSQLGEFIEKINKVCETLKKENMYFGYHNHAFEFKKINGVTIFDRLINETDSDVFNFIIDTYWIQIGGKNPPDVIRQLGKRAMALHFKDYVAISGWSPYMRMGEVGYGNLDWDAIIAACEDAGTRWALVEQDSDHFENDPFKSLEISYNFLEKRGFI